MKIQVGDTIEVIDTEISPFPIRGKVVSLDPHPFQNSYGQIEVDSVALPAPKVFVNLRMARVV